MTVATYVCPYIYSMLSTLCSLLENGDEEEEEK